MELEIRRAAIQPFLRRCKIVDPKAQIPALTGICFDAKDNVLLLRAADNNITLSVQARLSAQVRIPGSVVVDAERLMKAVDLMTSENVSFRLDQQLIVRGDRASYKLSTTRSDQYPKLPITSLPLTKIADIKKVDKALRTGLAGAAAVASDAGLDGVWLSICCCGALSVGMSTGWLLQCDNRTDKTHVQSCACLLPRMGATFLLDILQKAQDVAVRREGEYLFVRGQDQNFYAIKLLDQRRYPSFATIVQSQKPTTELKLETQVLAEALDRVLIMNKDGRIGLGVDGPEIELGAQETNYGQAQETLRARSAFGQTGTKTFLYLNGKFMATALAQMDPELRLRLTDAQNPVILDGGDVLAILAPMFGG